jgi:hypothetical protein
MRKRKSRLNCEYAVYKGDELLMIGTLPQIAEKRKVKVASLLWMLSPTYRRRCEKKRDNKRTILVNLDEELEVVKK